jgi:hypothetical protein
MTRKDVDMKHDFFIPFPDLSSKGVRGLFKCERCRIRKVNEDLRSCERIEVFWVPN